MLLEKREMDSSFVHGRDEGEAGRWHHQGLLAKHADVCHDRQRDRTGSRVNI